MGNRELRKLGRRELLELLMDAETKNAALSDELRKSKQQLQNREIIIRESGNLAEASLKLSGIFAAADNAVKQYSENIMRCSEQQQQAYERIIADARTKAQEILREADLEKKKRISEADAYWERLSTKLEDYYRAHKGLQEILSMRGNSRLEVWNEKKD